MQVGAAAKIRVYLALVKEGDESELAYALKWWRSGPRDWRVLYNGCECIRYDVSGGKRRAWEALEAVTPGGMEWEEAKKELDRFRDTAGPSVQWTGGKTRLVGARSD